MENAAKNARKGASRLNQDLLLPRVAALASGAAALPPVIVPTIGIVGTATLAILKKKIQSPRINIICRDLHRYIPVNPFSCIEPEGLRKTVYVANVYPA